MQRFKWFGFGIDILHLGNVEGIKFAEWESFTFPTQSCQHFPVFVRKERWLVDESHGVGEYLAVEEGDVEGWVGELLGFLLDYLGGECVFSTSLQKSSRDPVVNHCRALWFSLLLIFLRWLQGSTSLVVGLGRSMLVVACLS